MTPVARYLFPVLFLSTAAVCQLPSSRCDRLGDPLADCQFTTRASPDYNLTDSGAEHSPAEALRALGEAAAGSPKLGRAGAFVSSPNRPSHENFHWKRALSEAFIFLSISQAYVVHDDYRWVVVENGVPFNHYWRDYKESLSTWIHSGWHDGDPILYNYVGHPVQGALTGYIQIQNDPQGRALEFSNSKPYWWSRFKALLWNMAYSTQWRLGPLSEITVEKYGTKARSSWNRDGSWPCTQKPCYTGVGQSDLVVTPAGGFLWLLTEDLLDRKVSRRVEGATENRFLIDLTRCALNPVRGGANILHGKAPWHRTSRDAAQLYFVKHTVTPPDAEPSSDEK